MSAEPQLFRINYKSKESEEIAETNFTDLKLQERRDIQEWIVANPDILGEDLLIIAKEFSDFDGISDRLDLLAVDKDGKLVIIELKRDDSGSDVHWQAIKYASYFQHANQEDIKRMLMAHENISMEKAEERLLEHLEAGDLNALNNDQRIILASHRFAPQATSAVLWLNDKAPNDDLITCVQLTPYPDDTNEDSIYLQANTIIPVPGTERYAIRIGSPQDGGKVEVEPPPNSNDDVAHFLQKVVSNAILELAGGIKPNRVSYRAIGGRDHPWYRVWYSQNPWGHKRMRYRVILHKDGPSWKSEVVLQYAGHLLKRNLNYSDDDLIDLEDTLQNLATPDNQIGFSKGWVYSTSEKLKVSQSLDDDFANTLINILRDFIESITPRVNDFEDERNADDD